MTNLATVLIAAESVDFASALLERLLRNGYCGRSVDSGAAALAQARGEHPDILVIGPTLADMTPLALARVIKDDEVCANVPVVMITEGPDVIGALEAFEAGVDDVLADAFDLVALVPRIRPLLRISTMHAELRQRALTARDFGLDVRGAVTATPDARPAILLIGRQLADIKALIGQDVELTATDDLYEAEDLLAARNYDAAVVVTEGEFEQYLGFCTQVRNNPRLFNLPVLLVDGGEHGLDVVEAYRRGASRVLRRPLDPQQLRSAVLTLVRRQQLRWSIRRALHQTLAPPTQDRQTGAYNRDFLVRYLAHRVTAAKTEQRHLSVLFFAAPAIDRVRQEFGDEAAEHLLIQIGQWVGGLLRGEDLTALFQPNEFCVVLPDTPIDEAEVVMNRIAGVVSYTDFAVKDVYQPVKVWVQTGSAAVTAADTVDTLISRARAKLG